MKPTIEIRVPSPPDQLSYIKASEVCGMCCGFHFLKTIVSSHRYNQQHFRNLRNLLAG